MSSSNRFASGLNNWSITDKPQRADFVSDNAILDEHAMWKQDYDPDGSFAAEGGLAAAVEREVEQKVENAFGDTNAALDTKVAATDFAAHTGNAANPHGVTKAQVGLENVANVYQMPLNGGGFTGSVTHVYQNTNGFFARDIYVRTAASAGVATSRIIMNRK